MTLPGFSFRPMRDSDIHDVMVCERAAYEHPWSREIMRDCLRAGYRCWLAEELQRVVAHGVMRLSSGECHLLNIAVHPDRQGRGIGRRMVRRLLAVARQGGAESAFLEVRVSNRPAQRLYLAEGFREVGTRQGYYPAGEGSEDAIILARPLW